MLRRDSTPKTWSVKEITDKLDFIKMEKKKVCSANDTVKKMRIQATERGEIFTKDTSDKGL